MINNALQLTGLLFVLVIVCISWGFALGATPTNKRKQKALRLLARRIDAWKRIMPKGHIEPPHNELYVFEELESTYKMLDDLL